EEHAFNSWDCYRGFHGFMPLKKLDDLDGGYLVNDTCIIEADVAVRKVVDYVPYNSKKETGYVGLKNQGATCYVTSLLQTLYNIPYFRKAVYHMPTTEALTMPLALQSIFYKLQYGDTSVSTKELTTSFGWGTQESLIQQDIQEFNRDLCEKLEEKMKGTVVDGTIQRLFEGHHMNHIECIDVDYKSTRKESFYDLQLDVKGCRDVYASFDKYVEVERLEGDNKYHAEQHGLQDARKGILFTDFPPILQLHLKRFEYDFMKDTMVKINDSYEFPLQLDLDREDGKYLSPLADRSVRNLYTLHSVLVHRGGVHGGHYYAYIRPTLSDQWLKFDDEHITKEDRKSAMDEQYGGEYELPQENSLLDNSPSKLKYSNAYMLVYIRESDQENMMCNVDENDIAEHLRIRLKKEQEEMERKKKEREEAHLYRTIKVARDEDLKEQIGKDIYFDLVNFDRVRSFRVHVHTSLVAFKEELAKEFGIPVHCQRLWLWKNPQYRTYWPTRPLTPNEETQSVGQFIYSCLSNNAELELFLEVIEFGQDIHPISPPEKTIGEILLFFKLYDPLTEELRYAGRLIVKNTGKPIDILERLNEMAGFAPDEEIELFEEYRSGFGVKCLRVDKTLTFLASKLRDGDVICFQKHLKVENTETCRCPDVQAFLKQLQVVRFRSLEKPKEDEFSLPLLRIYNYDDVVARIAHHLNLDDPSKIRLASHNWCTEKPQREPIKYRGVGHLSDMLTLYNQTSDILYYEVLDIPLPELEGSKTLDVTFHDATKNKVVIHTIRLPKKSTVEDVINDLKTKIELSNKDAQLRLLEIHYTYNRIYQVFSLDEIVENIDDRCYTLRVEEVPEEEKDLGLQDCLIPVNHAPCWNQFRIFGDPFLLVVHEGETLAEVKVRIQKKLEVSDEEFSMWKFSHVSWGLPTPLQDSDIVLEYFQNKDVYGVAKEHFLQVEHSDNSPKRPYTANQNRHRLQKSVKIYK
nr:ubiquitin carboxyl-terminal hydrolase 12-like isoform X2 [Tanacetum cinerariifolium]